MMNDMDEAQARGRARTFLAGLGKGLTADLEAYARAVNARVRYEALEDGEAGFTLQKGPGFVITVNSNESREPQRFTICHELGHIVLGLPSSHGEIPSWFYAKRDPNELWCDVFASELLMPHELFERKIPEGEPSLGIVEGLAEAFGASFPATASRYASLVKFPCAYVIMDRGVVRYAAPNASFRRRGIRIPMKSPIPPGSVAQRLRQAGASSVNSGQIPQDVWLENCDEGYDLYELSRHYAKFDQTLSILWCTEDELPSGEVDRFNRLVADDDNGMEELSGVLTWQRRIRKR